MMKFLVALCIGTAGATVVDWRSKGIVPPVKNQGQMGSSWAEGLVDVIEMVHAQETGNIVDLSEAMAQDCCGAQPTADPLACLEKLGGLCAAADYPTPKGRCVKNCRPAFPLTGWVSDTVKPDVTSLSAAVKSAPVTAAIEADQPVFQEYMGGVLNSPSCGKKVDHIVTIVGFNDEAVEPYWIVRNTWGPQWGESGYVRIEMSDKDVCGIMSDVMSITAKSFAEA
eukprot:m.440034 g.440034  ORF g.440034 m.440034 type:complete len:225 (+) comp18457_c0_seq1:81-755(+)